MLLKLATSGHEIEEIVNLRKRVFVDELKIQDKDYQDVFNDYFCKNLMVMQDRQLLGSMRVAFDRYSQRFYASYFVTASSQRNRTTGVFLVGGMLRIMEENGIQTLYADSHQRILKEYLNFGCEIIGKPYKKYGFSCEWTPIRYQRSQCTSVARWMLERSRHFLSSQQCQWKFLVKLILCQTIQEYEIVLNSLIGSRQIFSIFPILTENLPSSLQDSTLTGVESIQTQSARVWLESKTSSLNSGNEEESSFDRINALIPQRRILAVKHNSPLLPMAKCYAILTGKHLQAIDCFSKLSIDRETESVWVWMMETDFNSNEWDMLVRHSRKVSLGLQLSKTVADCSIATLRNYLNLIQPQTRPIFFNPKNSLVEWNRDYHHFAAFGDSHQILSKGESCMNFREQSFCRELLENGFSFGDTVKRLNLEFSSSICSQPFLLVGDPALHIISQQSLVKVPVSTGVC
ncbi:hypothetical protein CKA32_004136 [Geitlerinema sp. FC II]|nr:hypothetical protein CKA32_004136 [Geitlerinema sp. FC II]